MQLFYRWLRRAILWLVFTGLYMLLISKADGLELLFGAVASIVCVAGVEAYLATSLIQFQPRMRDLLQIWHLPQLLVAGTWELLQAMRKQLFTKDGAPSVVLATPFHLGGLDAVSAARRMLAISYTTATPNFIVMGFWPDPSMNTSINAKPAGPPVEHGLMLYHQVIPGPVPTMVFNLGAEG